MFMYAHCCPPVVSSYLIIQEWKVSNWMRFNVTSWLNFFNSLRSGQVDAEKFAIEPAALNRVCIPAVA